jgi:hypothetical protein
MVRGQDLLWCCFVSLTRRSFRIKNDLSPIWNSLQDFEFQAKDDISKLVLKVECVRYLSCFYLLTALLTRPSMNEQ